MLGGSEGRPTGRQRPRHVLALDAEKLNARRLVLDEGRVVACSHHLHRGGERVMQAASEALSRARWFMCGKSSRWQERRCCEVGKELFEAGRKGREKGEEGKGGQRRLSKKEMGKIGGNW